MLSYSDAFLSVVALIREHFGDSAIQTGRVLRDAHGQITFVLSQNISDEQREQAERQLRDRIGLYARQDRALATPDDPGVGRLLNETPSQWLTSPWGRVATLDRRIVGADWLAQPEVSQPSPPVVAFASLKGGVGRTTALCVSAAELARTGSRVLVVDLDLEAPGAGALLLPDEGSRPRYGVVDYLVERSIGAASNDILNDMVALSPLGSTSQSASTGGPQPAQVTLPKWKGYVDVVPVFGTSCAPEQYLGQLARAVVDIGPNGTNLPLRTKFADLLAALSARSEYDVVLVDVRAGLAEISAGPILSLGANTLLFGTCQRQTLEDLRLLFAHLSTLIPPEANSPWKKIEFVLAKAPSSDHQWFEEDLYDLFQEYIYEAQDELEGFNFQRDDQDAPHYPTPIAFHPDFADWDPSRRASDLSHTFYTQAFEPFLARIRSILGVRE